MESIVFYHHYCFGYFGTVFGAALMNWLASVRPDSYDCCHVGCRFSDWSAAMRGWRKGPLRKTRRRRKPPGRKARGLFVLFGRRNSDIRGLVFHLVVWYTRLNKSLFYGGGDNKNGYSSADGGVLQLLLYKNDKSKEKGNPYRPAWKRKRGACKIHRNSAENNDLRAAARSAYQHSILQSEQVCIIQKGWGRNHRSWSCGIYALCAANEG